MITEGPWAFVVYMLELSLHYALYLVFGRVNHIMPFNSPGGSTH